MMRLAVSVVRRFYLTMALATTLVVIAGFAPSYYLRPFVRVTHYPTGIPVSPTLPLLIHIHAVVLSLWLVLLLVQTTLVAAGRTEVHKRLGIAGAALVPVILVLGVLTAIRGARDGWNPGGPFADSLEFLIVGLGDITLFTGFVAAALYYRRGSGPRPAVELRTRQKLSGPFPHHARRWPRSGQYCTHTSCGPSLCNRRGFGS